MTMIVDSIWEAFDYFLALNNTVVINKPKEVPTGWNMTVKSPEGTITEYVQHDPVEIAIYKKKANQMRFADS